MKINQEILVDDIEIFPFPFRAKIIEINELIKVQDDDGDIWEVTKDKIIIKS
jgi:hypothetical protein